jgi:hypothetical protein
MIENISLGSIMGAPAVGPDDEKIGTVGQVFVDPITGAPNWATVHTGLFGRHENFVPLEQASWDREKLHLPYGKDMVKDAPRIAADEALTPQSEEELYLYYGIGTTSPEASADVADQRAETQANAEGERHHDAEAEAAGAEYAQQSRMQRYAASDGDANPDAAPPVSATSSTTTEQPAVYDPVVDSVPAVSEPAVAEPMASEPAHTDPAPHDSQPKGPRHRA